MSSVTSDRFIGIAGCVVGIVGVMLAIYYGRRAEKKRQPTFSLLGHREKLVGSVIHKFGDFVLMHKGSAITEGDLVGMWFRFWNSGSLPILAEDVLTPYAAVLPEGCRVLDIQIQAVSRKEVRAEVTFSENEIQIKTAILEPNDGLRIQLIYSGPLDAKLEFRGACIGAPQPTVLSPESVRDVPIGSNLKRSTINFFRPILAVTAVVGIFSLLDGVVRRYFPRFVHYFLWSILVLFLILMAGVFGTLFWQWVTKKSVPKTLSNR